MLWAEMRNKQSVDPSQFPSILDPIQDEFQNSAYSKMVELWRSMVKSTSLMT